MKSFFERVHRLNYIDRCSNIPHIKPYSVAQHSFYTAFYAMLFADLENESGENYDTSEVLKRALLHDMEEAITGDILYPLHNSHPAFKSKLDDIRRGCVASEVFNELPENVRKCYIKLWNNAKDNTKEGRLVACMDKFEILLFAVSEMELGNMQFYSLFKNAKDLIFEKFPISSVIDAINEIEEGMGWNKKI